MEGRVKQNMTNEKNLKIKQEAAKPNPKTVKKNMVLETQSLHRSLLMASYKYKCHSFTLTERTHRAAQS